MTARRTRPRLCGAALAATMLAGCAAVPPPSAPPAAPAPEARPAAPRVAARSEESLALERFYVDLQARLLESGRLRRDTDPPDVPFGPAELARSFERVALFSEYAQVSGRYVAQQSEADLRRWERPVRVQLHFGASVDAATRADDTARVAAYLDRLRGATGHPIALVRGGGNFHVFVASLDEQRALGPAILEAEPGLGRETVREITSLDRETYCAVYASSSSDRPNSYVSAIALVRAEHPDLMREACYHEEIAQGLGLANDAPEARPSIFNDDEEFGLLTRHDAALLRMLYDPRLRVGMTAPEARPIVRLLAVEIVDGGAV